MSTIDDDKPGALFDGDTGTLHPEARWVLTRVLAEKAITANRHGAVLWEALLRHHDKVVSRMHDMYIDLDIDVTRQVAFKRQIRPPDQSYRVLLKEATYSREATVLLLYLRDIHFQRSQAGEQTIRTTRDDMLNEMGQYVPPSERDLVGRRKAMAAAVESLTTQTLLIPVPGQDGLFEVSPAIEPLLGVEAIERITEWLTQPDEHRDGAAVIDGGMREAPEAHAEDK